MIFGKGIKIIPDNNDIYIGHFSDEYRPVGLYIYVSLNGVIEQIEDAEEGENSDSDSDY